ncbi:MAG: EpsI family protein [Desulfuromonadaceae bacterium]|nr:EpsI family protein [Desulfuromonadaceae bacterium]
MGKIAFARWGKLVFFVLLLLLTAGFVHIHKGGPGKVFSGPPLAGSLARIGEWIPGDSYPLSSFIIESLALDDHLWRPYRMRENRVELYVGFYHTAEKIGAAHDPLVCFSGQGWVLGQKETGEIGFADSKTPKVSYAAMVAENEERKEYILYWFQSYGYSSSGTLAQKLAMIRSRFFKQGEANAFVRINVRFDTQDVNLAKKTAEEFVKDFYPVFYRYVTEN